MKAVFGLLRAVTRLRYVLIGVVVVAVAAVLVIVHIVRDNRLGPVATVRAYLEAVQAGDLREAMEIAMITDLPGRERGQLLQSEAMGGIWEILEVSELEFHGERARVRVRLGRAEETITGDFTVSDVGDDWRIDNPFAEITVPRGPLRYFEVNGVKAKLTDSYLLFPGFYDLYSSARRYLTVQPRTLGVLPGRAETLQLQQVSLTMLGALTARDAVAHYLDRCAEYGVLKTRNCPIAAVHPEFDEVVRIGWRITEYPEADPQWQAPLLAYPDSARGTVEHSGVGVELSGGLEPNGQREFTQDCEFSLAGFEVTLDPDVNLSYVTLSVGPVKPDVEAPELDSCP